ARRTELDQQFISALGRTRKLARGPKPGRALREIGLEPQLTTEKPTSEGVAEMLARVDVRDHRVGLQLYPDKDRSEEHTSELQSLPTRRSSDLRGGPSWINNSSQLSAARGNLPAAQNPAGRCARSGSSHS